MIRRALIVVLMLAAIVAPGPTRGAAAVSPVPLLFGEADTARSVDVPEPAGVDRARTFREIQDLGSILQEPRVDVEFFDGRTVRFDTMRSDETELGRTQWWGTAVGDEAFTAIVIVSPATDDSPQVVAAEFLDGRGGHVYRVHDSLLLERPYGSPGVAPHPRTEEQPPLPPEVDSPVPADPIETWPTREVEIISGGPLPITPGGRGGEHTISPTIMSDGPSTAPSPATPTLTPGSARAEAPADTNIIDLLVIYTPQAATDAGGASHLETDIELAVAQTNQALDKGKIDSWVRLVDTRQATYTQASSMVLDRNNLTAGTGGLADEHGWRDDVEADLMAMIVPDATDACGIAWIPQEVVGGSQWAYSVSAYECMPGGSNGGGFVLTHELGHNFGGQHSIHDPHGDEPFTDNPDNKGHIYATYPNAFGTVMAYTTPGSGCPSGCPRRLIFSNPSVTEPVSGQPAGQTGVANNARGMGLLAPYISRYRCVTSSFGSCYSDFRAQAHTVSGTYTRALVGDYDGDGRSDVFWYGAGGPQGTCPGSLGCDALSYGTATGFEIGAVTVNGTYNPIVGDFDADGRDDIFWYGPGAAHDVMWYGSPTGFATYSLSFGGNQIPIVGNFNGGSGADDILFYGPPSTPPYHEWDRYWQGKVTRGFVTSEEVISGFYDDQLVGDYNGDGRDDIFWYGEGSANDRLWYGANTPFSKSFIPTQINGTYEHPKVGNFNGGSFDDILWYRTSSTTQYIDYGKSGSGFTQQQVTQGSSYIPLVGNFNGDEFYGAGRDDIYWFGPSTGAEALWYGRASGTGGLLDYPDPYYSNFYNYEELIGDYNGDGCDDILWYGPGGIGDGLYYGMDPLHDNPPCAYS